MNKTLYENHVKIDEIEQDESRLNELLEQLSLTDDVKLSPEEK